MTLNGNREVNSPISKALSFDNSQSHEFSQDSSQCRSEMSQTNIAMVNELASFDKKKRKKFKLDALWKPLIRMFRRFLKK